MSKVSIKTTNTDPFLAALRTRHVGPAGDQQNDSGMFKVTVLDVFEPDVPDSWVNWLSIRQTTLKIELLVDGNIESLLQGVLIERPQEPYIDLNCSIVVPDHISTVQSLNLNKTVASYDVFTHFNYISKEYNDYAQNIDESSMAPSWQGTRGPREEFILGGPFPYNTNPIPDAEQVVVPPWSPNDQLSQFPYYNQIKISNQVTNDFSNVINDLGISTNFLDGYLNLPSPPVSFQVKKSGESNVEKSIPVFDVKGWINLGYLGDSGFMFDLRGGPRRIASSPLFEEFRKNVFNLATTTMANRHFRSYMDIVNSKRCYTEDFAYEIHKHRNTATGSPDQVFVVVAEDNISMFNDTQIQYGRTYVYKCLGHYVIVGNKYYYTNLSVDNDNNTAVVDVVDEPYLIILPLDLFQESIVTIQPPPLYPKVRFETYMNSSNDLRMYLSPTKGWQYEPFTTITPEDQVQLNSLIENKRSTDINPGFRFETATEDGLYEIFKTQIAPKSITDFANKKLTEIRMPYNTPDAVYEDKVQPNTKYYYLFRKVNTHGLVSNPTSIYEVELIVDADDSKVIVNDYEIPIPAVSQKSKTFQSLFQIKPAVEHVMFNPTQEHLLGRNSLANTLDYITLGIADKPIWSKRFKFRIRSTTSGKIIDYNVTFKLTKDKSEEDF